MVLNRSFAWSCISPLVLRVSSETSLTMMSPLPFALPWIALISLSLFKDIFPSEFYYVLPLPPGL